MPGWSRIPHLRRAAGWAGMSGMPVSLMLCSAAAASARRALTSASALDRSPLAENWPRFVADATDLAVRQVALGAVAGGDEDLAVLERERDHRALVGLCLARAPVVPHTDRELVDGLVLQPRAR